MKGGTVIDVKQSQAKVDTNNTAAENLRLSSVLF